MAPIIFPNDGAKEERARSLRSHPYLVGKDTGFVVSM